MESTQSKTRLGDALQRAISEYPLESHPFLDRFAAGGFAPEAIRWWAIKMLPGSNRFNQAFLRVASQIDDFRARILLLRNVYSEHGDLDPDAAHVALYMRFMRGIHCSRIDVHEDDGAFRVPELRFKRFEIQATEPVIWSLGRFAAIEAVLPAVFTRYIEGLRKIFPGIDDHTIEYFHVHCELDPTHTDELLQVASLYVATEDDVTTFGDGVRDMLLSLTDMFGWMNRNMAAEAGLDDLLHAAPGSPLPRHRQSADRLMIGEDEHLFDVIHHGSQAVRREAAFVLDQLAGKEQPAILELCAATGTHARILADQGARVVGTDPSETMLRLARQRVPEAEFVAADMRSIALTTRFDAVICMNGSIHCLAEPQDVVRALRRAFDHLAPGAVLVVDLRDRDNLPESPSSDVVDGYLASESWLRRKGADDSDLYAISACQPATGRQFLEVQNRFHLDPFRIANWARLTGFEDVRLHPDFRSGEIYQRSTGEHQVVMVARRPPG